MPHTALIANHELSFVSRGEGRHRSVDLLGRVYEYFLTRFASAEGKNGGQFDTPSCVARLLVDMLAPYTARRGSAFRQREASSLVVSAAKDKGRIHDPACGSGGTLVQSGKLVEFHGGKNDDIRIYDQESNATTRRLAFMNLAIRDIEADFGPEHADTFHPDLRADCVLANGSMSSNQSGEGDIRRALIEAGLVDCMVALPGQL